MFGDRKLLRLPKALKRRQKETPHQEVHHGTQLPQDIWNQIIEEYHNSYPEQPLHQLLLTSRCLYDATIPSLYQAVVFTIAQGGRAKWQSLLTSLRKYARFVRKLDITELRGPDEQTELKRPTFPGYLADLFQLRALSITCLGAKLPVQILLTASRLPRLEVLELTNLSLVKDRCPSSPFRPMKSLREIRLADVREHDGSLKWSTFLPCTLNRSLRRFQYRRPGNDQDVYSFLRPLEADPELTFPDMRELSLPRPITEADTDRAIDLLQRCPGLLSLEFKPNVLDGVWGNQINELGSRLPRGCLNKLDAISGPPGLVSAVAPGRPIRKATILLEMPIEFPLLSTLAALKLFNCPLEVLVIWTTDWRETSLQVIVEFFPQLQTLGIFVSSAPALTLRDWKLEPLFALNRLERLCLVGIDGAARPAPQPHKTERRVAIDLFKAIPSLQELRLHPFKEKWKREGLDNPSSSRTLGQRILGMWPIPTTWR